MKTYRVHAEHVNGKSLTATTPSGVVSDPTTVISGEYQASSAFDAETTVMNEMDTYAKEQGLDLTEEWWNSVAVSVTRDVEMGDTVHVASINKTGVVLGVQQPILALDDVSQYTYLVRTTDGVSEYTAQDVELILDEDEWH